MRMNRHTVYALLCLSALALSGCKVKRPKEIIAEDKMENIIYDYHLAKAMGDELPMDENYKRQMYLDAVFSKYGVTEAEFDSSLVWYTRNTTRLDDIYEKVANRMKDDVAALDDQMAVREKRNSTSESGDSVDVWAWRKIVSLNDSPLDNLFTFVLSADSNYHVNDRFVWTSDVIMGDGKVTQTDAPVMSLQLVYDNDSVVGVTRHILKSGRSVIALGDDKIGCVKSINGFIYRPLNDKTKGDIVVGNISLMRYHSNDTVIATAVDTAAVDSAAVDTLPHEQSLKTAVEQAGRLNPDEMNRRRTTVKKVERPEQIEVEEKIEKERAVFEKQNKAHRLPPSRKR